MSYHLLVAVVLLTACCVLEVDAETSRKTSAKIVPEALSPEEMDAAIAEFREQYKVTKYKSQEDYALVWNILNLLDNFVNFYPNGVSLLHENLDLIRAVKKSYKKKA